MLNVEQQKRAITRKLEIAVTDKNPWANVRLIFEANAEYIESTRLVIFVKKSDIQTFDESYHPCPDQKNNIGTRPNEKTYINFFKNRLNGRVEFTG